MNKYVFLLCFGFLSLSLSAQENTGSFFEEADQFFSQHVREGKIDYQQITADPKELYQLVRQVITYNLDDKNESTQKAFLINAYNIHVIKSVVDAWPIGSTQQVDGFFDAKKHVVAGESYTLDELEKQFIFGKFPDPRLHFVLVCAAIGCPPLTTFAYTPDSLESQLDQQTYKALNRSSFIQVNDAKQTVGISQIFQWYPKDFKVEHPTVLSYINSHRNDLIPDNYKISYYPYDWTINALGSLPGLVNPSGQASSNIQQFTPSVLLKKGQVEIKVFNNVYTQTAFRDNERQKVDLGQRETFYTGIFQFNYGVSQDRRWNVGFELDYQGVRLDQDLDSSPLRVLGTSTDNLIFQKHALTYIGPRIRFAPFRNIPKFSLTSTLQIPVSNDLELFADGQRRFLAHNRVNWWTQFFFDKTFGQWQLFTEVDFLYRFPTNQVSFNQDAFFLTPVIAFLSYFPNPKVTLNVNAQYWPTFQGLPGNSAGEGFSLSGDFVQLGIGGKYQLTPEVNLEVIYTNFATSRNNGAGQTFNFGIVFIK